MMLRQLLHNDPVGVVRVWLRRKRHGRHVCDPIDDPELYVRATEENGIRIRFFCA